MLGKPHKCERCALATASMKRFLTLTFALTLFFALPSLAQSEDIDTLVVDTFAVADVDFGAYDEDSLEVPSDSAFMAAVIQKELQEQFGEGVDVNEVLNDPDAFCQKMRNRHDLKARTLISLSVIEPFIGYYSRQKSSGEAVSDGNADILNTRFWTDFYSAIFEHQLLIAMGGDDAVEGQILSALRGNLAEAFAPVIQRNPEIYCQAVDSVAQYLRDLDYIGEIYKGQDSIKSAADQEATVYGMIEALDKMKDNIREQAQAYELFTQLMTDLYRNPKNTDFSKYFTSEAQKAIKKRKLKLKLITPSTEWDEWDASDIRLCSLLPYDENTYSAIISKYDLNLALQENAKESDVKGFYITFEKHGDKLLISSFVDLRNG